MQHVWDLLLDPKIMAGCVPGTESVEVISDVEYIAVIKVKISFISARFRIKTNIVETRPPSYLRCEGTGEDKSVASSMKQVTELFLNDLGDAGTEIIVQTKADVLGRLGSFGLSVMRTKANRMWEEFGDNFTAIALADRTDKARVTDAAAPGGLSAGPHQAMSQIGAAPPPPMPAPGFVANGSIPRASGGLWRRLVGGGDAGSEQRQPNDIYVEVRRGKNIVKILWPAGAPGDLSALLRDALK
jgi:carbon monoxide dehydrogenase subunit G